MNIVRVENKETGEYIEIMADKLSPEQIHESILRNSLFRGIDLSKWVLSVEEE